MNRDVLKALPCETVVRQPTLNPSDENLHHRPEPHLDQPLVLGAFHVDAILHGEHIRWVHPPLYTPPGDEGRHLSGLDDFEDTAGARGWDGWVLHRGSRTIN